MAKKAKKPVDKSTDETGHIKVVGRLPAAIERGVDSNLDAILDRAEEIISASRILLYRQYPFVGYLLLMSEYTFSLEVPTMAATTIGGPKVFINPKFVVHGLKTRKQNTFVMAHEILHIYLDHIGRQMKNGYDAQLWNYATDFCINGYIEELIQLNNSGSCMERPLSALYDEKFKDYSSDQIYNFLLDQADGSPKKAIEDLGGVYKDDRGEGEKGDGSGKGQIGGDYNDGHQRPFDEVSDEQTSAAQDAERMERLAGAVNAEESSKSMGSGSGGLFRMFKDLLAPKLPWKTLLQDYIVSSSNKDHNTYNRVSRRSTIDIILPAKTGEEVNLLIGIDTSGSMGAEDLGEALSEIKAICDTFESWTVELISCDTVATPLGKYSSESGDTFENFNRDLVGGGGTDMSPLVRYGEESYLRSDDPPSVNIIITDGYIPTINGIEEIPVLCVVTSSGNKDLKQSNIKIIHMNKDNE